MLICIDRIWTIHHHHRKLEIPRRWTDWFETFIRNLCKCICNRLRMKREGSLKYSHWNTIVHPIFWQTKSKFIIMINCEVILLLCKRNRKKLHASCDYFVSLQLRITSLSSFKIVIKSRQHFFLFLTR